MHYVNASLKVPLPDVIDRISILSLKRARLTDEKDRPSVENEYALYQRVLQSYRDEGVHVQDDWVSRMEEVNATIWDVEAEIRNSKRNQLPLDTVGGLWLKLRDLNNVRNGVRAKIDEEINTDFFQVPAQPTPVAGPNLKLPLHEAIDRITICELKLERLKGDSNYAAFQKEYGFYRRVVDSYRNDDHVQVKDEWLARMKEINGTVWTMEAAVRQGKEGDKPLAELGQLVLDLRELSKVRVSHKNSVAAAIGSSFYEVKTETT